ncbi:MAG: sigma-70 family RNA polymerase sigma factor [Phycisphaerales bacterium]
MDEIARRAFALWTDAQPVVSAFVHALVADRAERDDALQSVAMAVLESFPDYDPARPFLPWAMGIARHVVVNEARSRRRRPALLSPEAADALAQAMTEVAESQRDRLRYLADCLSRLRGQAREVCDLRYRRDLKPAHIATILGLQPNTVAKSLQRVREQLRACIEERLTEEGGT